MEKEGIAREIESYQHIIGEIWRRIAPVLGPLSLRAIAERAVALTSAEFKFIGMIRVTDEGLSLEKLWEELDTSGDPRAIRNGFRKLVVNLMDILTGLTGGILVNRLLREVEGLRELTEEEV